MKQYKLLNTTRLLRRPPRQRSISLEVSTGDILTAANTATSLHAAPAIVILFLFGPRKILCDGRVSTSPIGWSTQWLKAAS